MFTWSGHLFFIVFLEMKNLFGVEKMSDKRIYISVWSGKGEKKFSIISHVGFANSFFESGLVCANRKRGAIF